MSLKLIGQHDLNGYGKTMQLMTYKNYLYVGNLTPGVGTAIFDVANPRQPKLVGSLPAFHNSLATKVQIVDDLLIVNYECRTGEPAERVGLGIYHLSDPVQPREIAYYHTGGKGVHRTWFSGNERYVFVSAVPEGFNGRMLLILDIQDPSHPFEVGRWWLKGQWVGGNEKPDWPEGLRYQLHHAIIHSQRAYLGMWDAGVYILDISDVSKPREISHLNWGPHDGGHTHTALPLPERNLLVVADEASGLPGQESPKHVRLLDISDEKNPRLISKFPVPEGECRNIGPRFGPHNLHENRPGSLVSDYLMFVTYFSGGLRVVNISDPYRPKEIDFLIPSPMKGIDSIQMNDVFVQPNGLVFLSDRAGSGIYIAEFSG